MSEQGDALPQILSGSRAIVTAAGSGIGRATALALSAAGADVIAVDIDEELLATLMQKAHRINGVRVDVTNASELETMMGSAGEVNVLVNCVGGVSNGTVIDFDADKWSRDWNLNVVSMANAIKNVLPGMMAVGSGSIINISSVVSSVKGAKDRCLYGTTKAAVIGLTKSVAVDFVEYGVRCNAICPGTIATPSLDERISAFVDPAQARKDFIARQPMGRLGTAEEIASLALYLASPSGAFATGQAYVVDGGWSQ